MNEEMKKGYHQAQVDILCRLMDRFSFFIEDLAMVTGLSVEEVRTLVKQREDAKRDELYNEYAKRYTNSYEVLFRLCLAGVSLKYLSDKFKVPFEQDTDVYDLIPRDTVSKVYHDLMQEKNRNDEEEFFCCNYTKGLIEGRITSLQTMYTRLKNHNMPESEISSCLKVSTKRLKKYASMSPLDVKKYADDLVYENIDEDTGHLMNFDVDKLF